MLQWQCFCWPCRILKQWGVRWGTPPQSSYWFLCFFEVPYKSHICRKIPLKPWSNAWRGFGRRKFHAPKPSLSPIMEVENYPMFAKETHLNQGTIFKWTMAGAVFFLRNHDISNPDTAGYFFGHLKLAKIKALIFPKIGQKYPFLIGPVENDASCQFGNESRRHNLAI